ncbi:MAG: type I-C CRISPR-associated protein Cas8c/Csd1, partial [Lachnospiraceae bacterium]|nr:type I-C CRISPR-associated protein Cas8c/Csd1 [Lachnospiraceae bacterium]
MILQALVKYYEDLRKQGKIAAPGWAKVRVAFGLNLNSAGEVISLLPLKIPKERGKKTVYEARELEVPQPVKRAVDITPNFLCDNTTYVLGIDEKGKPDRSRKCFYAFRDFHAELLSGQQGEAAHAVLLFLQGWEPEQAEKCAWVSENWKELMAGANILFYYE